VLLSRVTDLRKRLFIHARWNTGGRLSEILPLAREDFALDDPLTSPFVVLRTLKQRKLKEAAKSRSRRRGRATATAGRQCFTGLKGGGWPRRSLRMRTQAQRRILPWLSQSRCSPDAPVWHTVPVRAFPPSPSPYSASLNADLTGVNPGLFSYPLPSSARIWSLRISAFFSSEPICSRSETTCDPYFEAISQVLEKAPPSFFSHSFW